MLHLFISLITALWAGLVSWPHFTNRKSDREEKAALFTPQSPQQREDSRLLSLIVACSLSAWCMRSPIFTLPFRKQRRGCALDSLGPALRKHLGFHFSKVLFLSYYKTDVSRNSEWLNHKEYENHLLSGKEASQTFSPCMTRTKNTHPVLFLSLAVTLTEEQAC